MVNGPRHNKRDFNENARATFMVYMIANTREIELQYTTNAVNRRQVSLVLV